MLSFTRNFVFFGGVLMKKLKIITDSNSGIKQHEGEIIDVYVVPMPFCINGCEYFEEISLSTEEFYKFLSDDVNISTSMPSQYFLSELFENTLKEYEKIIYIPMTSGLSNSYQAASNIANEFNGRVHVIDNKRISVTLKESILEACYMRDNGYEVEDIINYLYDTKHVSSIYISVDTLKYLKKGGRVKPAAAALASLLKIKPVLFSKGDKFDTLKKCRSLSGAKRAMINQIKYEIENEFKDYYEKGVLTLSIAHTENYEEALRFKEELIEEFPNIRFRFIDSLSLSVSCHIGPGALACAIIINSYC